jgi:hypothetical protein
MRQQSESLEPLPSEYRRAAWRDTPPVARPRRRSGLRWWGRRRVRDPVASTRCRPGRSTHVDACWSLCSPVDAVPEPLPRPSRRERLYRNGSPVPARKCGIAATRARNGDPRPRCPRPVLPLVLAGRCRLTLAARSTESRPASRLHPAGAGRFAFRALTLRATRFGSPSFRRSLRISDNKIPNHLCPLGRLAAESRRVLQASKALVGYP